jgi:hypothetical protein
MRRARFRITGNTIRTIGTWGELDIVAFAVGLIRDARHGDQLPTQRKRKLIR